MKALAKSFSTNQFFFLNFNYCKSYHGKTKILKIFPFLKILAISSPCYLVIAKINDFTRNNRCMTKGYTTNIVITSECGQIRTKISQKRVDLFVLAVSKNALSVKQLFKKHISV